MNTALILLCLVPAADAEPSFRAVVETEEVVYKYESADNGSGPLWCHGSTCLVRADGRTFATSTERIPDVKPLNNCRWSLFERTDAGWNARYTDSKHRTREPSPMVTLAGGRVFVSTNPTLTPPEAQSGPARPEIVEFAAGDPALPIETIVPKWSGDPPFTEHSYRSFAADGPRKEMILFQNVGYTHAEWAFRDAGGRWVRSGRLKWPWGESYEKPQPIRVCYPAVALRDGAVHFFGVSDIVEPKSAWRAYKKELTGRNWDYDFRRLFYTTCPNIREGKFQPWIEIASREETGGNMFPGDLHIAENGDVLLLWRETAIDVRLREKFFPEAKQSNSVRLAVVRDGAVVARRTLCESLEGESNLSYGTPRFQATPDGRLFVVLYVGGKDAEGKRVNEDRLILLDAERSPSETAAIPFKEPLTSFFTATPRAGSLRSDVLEMLGSPSGTPSTIGYRRVRLRKGADTP